MSDTGQQVDLTAHGANSTTLIMQVWWVRETSAFIQATYRSLGGFICMCAVANALRDHPSVELAWVAAGLSGASVIAGVVQKVTEIKKS